MPEGMSIQSVRRAMELLKLIGAAGNTATLKELSEQMQLSQSTVHNLLRTLRQGGFVTQPGPGAPYSLGYALLALAGDLTANDRLRRAAKPLMRQLAGLYNESVNLSVYDSRSVFFIANADCDQTVKITFTPGMRALPYCTSCGKLLLAALDEPELQEYLERAKLTRRTAKTITDREQLLEELARIRAQGYAVDAEELSESTRCFSAPVRDAHGQVVAALSISFPDGRSSLYDQEQIVADVKETAGKIGAAAFLGGTT